MSTRPILAFFAVMPMALRALGLGGAMLLLLAALGWVWAGGTGVAVALATALATAFLLPVAGPDLALRLLGGRLLPAWQALDLYALADRLARRAGLTSPPTLYVTPTPLIEVVAVAGTETQADGIALSSGALRTLPPAEIEAVMAHEISHLASGDLRLFRIIGAVGATIRILAVVGLGFTLAALLAAPAADAGAGETLGLSPVVVLLFAISPLAATLLELALWRSREYAADAGAARLVGSPLPLVSALRRIDALHQSPWINRMLRRNVQAVALPGLLRTHPATEQRVQRLLHDHAPTSLLS